MKIPALTVLGALGALLSLTPAHAVEYSPFNAPPNVTYPDGSTVITGIRGASATPGDVVITASYITGSGGETLPAIYSGSLAMNDPAGWHILTPVFSDDREVTTATLYGPNTDYYDSSLDGNIRAVGSYKYNGGGPGNHGLMYVGPVNGVGGTWSTIDVPSSLANDEPILNTIAHSNMGNFVVGNYDVQIDEGIAFLYNIATDSYSNLTPVEDALSITAYGIWENADGTYTVAGGYSDLNRAGADAGYLALYNSDFTSLLDVRKYQYQDLPLEAFISHFNGIVGTADGYHLTGDHINLEPGTDQLGFFASVKLIDGKFGAASWEAIHYPDATITSGNTVYGNTVLGVADGPDGSTSYIATVPEPTVSFLLLGSAGALFLARRKAHRLA